MKWGVMFCLFVLLGCDGLTDSRRRDGRDLEGEDPLSRERERLRIRSENVIDAFLDGRAGSSHSYEEYDGPKCKLSEECKEICDEFRSIRSKCYNQPESLVRDLKGGLFELIRLSEVKDSVRVSPSLFYGILELDIDLVKDLIEEHMSKGDLKSFLAWIAFHDDIASVLERADRRRQILKTAFEELGKLQTDARQHIKAGLNTGLAGADDTFFYVASDSDNETAFVMAHEILDDECSNRNCKLEIYCTRTERVQSRRRELESLFFCRTPEDGQRRSARETMCYVHGSDVWGYLHELIGDEEIRDSDLGGAAINVDRCKRVCGNRNSRKCEIIL